VRSPRRSGRIVDVMTGANKRKQSLYFPERMLDEMRFEAARLDRSVSWIVPIPAKDESK
jgi:uncharacterized small protein (TIGR04563 family)